MVVMMTVRLVVLVAILTATAAASAAAAAAAAADVPPFSTEEVATMLKLFEANLNIDGSGGVVASPDRSTPGGSYYYHWARDGALSMNTLQLMQGYASSLPLMKQYVQWVLRMFTMHDPNVDVRVEAKFNLPDGTPYTGGWCRPQTDGPALRARTLTRFAENLLANGQRSYVEQYLFTNSTSDNTSAVDDVGAIQHDLDWIVDNWRSNGCDLWEEVHSTDFFWNRFIQRRALYVGASLAERMGDTVAAGTYTHTAEAIGALLPQHYADGYIQEASVRPVDGATVCALNNGYNDDGLFGPTDSRVADTIGKLNKAFHAEFPINSGDDRAGVPGILYGRYPGDTYGGGNPWILATNCLAELYYRGAVEVARTRTIPDLSAWSRVLNISTTTTTTIADVHDAFITAGDGVLQRVRYHVAGAGFHLSEQLDKNTGYETSATDLTWSYATLLKAMHFRGVSLSALP